MKNVGSKTFFLIKEFATFYVDSNAYKEEKLAIGKPLNKGDKV